MYLKMYLKGILSTSSLRYLKVDLKVYLRMYLKMYLKM